MERALARDPANPRLRAEVVRLSMAARRFDRALELAISGAADDLQLAYWLGLIRSRSGIVSSLPVWEDVDRRLRNAGDAADEGMKKIAKHYLDLARGGHELSPTMRLRSARVLADAGSFLPALVEADAAVTAQPDLVEGWTLLATLHRRAMLFDLASTEYERALEILDSPNAPEAAYEPGELLLERARVLLALGPADAAREAYRKAAAAGRPAPYEEGLAALWAGRKREARRLFEQVVAEGGERAASAKAKLKQM